MLIYFLSSKNTDEKLIFCDVGQGDATLYINGQTQVLIDGGNIDAKVLSCLRKYMPPLDDQIEIIVATHPDQDHIGGLIEVLAQYKVANFVLPPYQKDTNTYKLLLDILSFESLGR